MKSPSLFKEYIWLLETIHRAGGISLAEINELWLRTEMSGGVEIARTTFHRHLDAIAEIFGVYVEATRGKNGKYHIVNRHVLEDDSVQQWMLTTLSVNNVLTESVSVADRILLEGMPDDHGLVRTIIEAMKRNRRLHLRYQKYGEERASERDIDAFCLKLYHRRWYLLANSITTADGGGLNMRVFALDRVKGLTITDVAAAVPADFRASEYFADCFGVVNLEKQKVERIVLRAFGNERFYMQDLPMHPSQRMIAEGDGFVDFELRLKPSYDFTGHLLSRGTYIKVLEPQSLVDDMARTTEKMAEMYRS